VVTLRDWNGFLNHSDGEFGFGVSVGGDWGLVNFEQVIGGWRSARAVMRRVVRGRLERGISGEEIMFIINPNFESFL
jgi:hypothetical protein